ncbi:MAG: hypothetical protein JO232_01415 [Verrucomicrobia bacterium]|nr:hypothetical protein [Verrucomicrobiota bacterium]
MKPWLTKLVSPVTVVLLTAAILVLCGFGGFALGSATSATQAIRASDFLDSLGVCTHIIQGIDSPTSVEAGIRYLGVRNLRDDGTTNRRLVSALCSIHSATGVMVDELPAGGDLGGTQAQWEQLAACGALLAAEGPNEPNNFPLFYNGSQCSFNNGNGTFLPCAQFQAALYSMVRHDPKLARIPVWGMTEVGAEPDNVGLQWLKIPSGSNSSMPDGTQYADVANAHNYVQGNGSSGQTLEDNQAFWAESVDRGGSCVGCFDAHGEYWGGAGGSRSQGTWAKGYPINVLGQNQIPKVTTETGWNITKTPSVSDDMRGRLLTDVYFQAYRQGWSKTFIYLMFNNGGDRGFGMMDTPGRPTMLGQYIHNLTSILADNSSAFSPGSVNCSFSGMPSTGYTMLMQKSNGKYELAVWGEAFASRTPSTITINLDATYPVKVYDVTEGPTPVRQLGRVSSVQVTLTDHVIIVEF